MSKSKLSNSIVRSIEGGKPSPEPKPADNTDYAFEQAGNLSGSIHSQGVGVSADGETDLVADQKPSGSPQERPQRLKSSVMPSKPLRMATACIAISIIALMLSSWALISLGWHKGQSQEEVASLDAAVGNLNARTDGLTADLAKVDKRVQDGVGQAEAIVLLRRDLDLMRNSVDGMRGELELVRTSLQTQDSAIKDQRSGIDQLTTEMSQLQTRFARTPSRAATPQPRRPVVPASTNEIEGAIMASIDLWGTQPYVMLREAGSSWVPLTIGDSYKGWKLKSVEDTEATFQKGSRTKQIKTLE